MAQKLNRRKGNTDAAPPDEATHDPAAPGISEPDPKRVPHPAREKAIRAASKAIHQEAAEGRAAANGPPGKAEKGGTAAAGKFAKSAGSKKSGDIKKAAKKPASPDRAAREAAAAAALSPELPEALRRLAGNDRVTVRRDGAPDPNGKTVVYWMQRAERGVDNAALDCAVAVANELGLPVVVYFAGISNFPHANLRHYVFLNEGLRDVEADLAKRNISFVLRNAPREDRLTFFRDAEAAIVIGDENPMRVPESWRREIAEKLNVPFWTVDADVIVPMKRFDKAQYAAYTIRTRLWKMLPEYLEPNENLTAKHTWQRPRGFFSDDVQKDMTEGWAGLDRSVGRVPELTGGAHAAEARLQLFVEKMLAGYAHNRNHPEVDGTSVLSPYLHYGHLSPLRIYFALEQAASQDHRLRESVDSFLDEMVTWRELCINWVKYDPNYDNPECAEEWARKTVAAHAGDKREHVYTAEQMERAQTFDELWNAAQRQMVHRGWMHNFMRMYWAKKILEWSPSNADAMKTLIYLNDKYFLDGRDPGGYAGIAWAVYGKFDRPWGERPIFGKIRYMSGASTGRKFNSKQYIAQNGPLDDSGGAAPATSPVQPTRARKARGQYGS